MYQTIDMHCDTLLVSRLTKGADGDCYDQPIGQVDIRRLLKGGALAQFFAIFILPEGMYRDYMKMDPIPEDAYIEDCVHILKRTIENHRDEIALAESIADIERNMADGKLSCILSMEDGVAVHGNLEKLDHFYDLGIRALSLTWNLPNCFGSPNSKDPDVMSQGLTEFGKAAVRHMQDIGMLVDVSHLSDAGFWDVVKLARVPFVATHSCCRAVCNHTRNLTDEMIKALAEKGGVMGINFGPEFLDDTPGNQESRISDMVRMIIHAREIGGVDAVAIGTDFDGIEGNLEIGGPNQMALLYDALTREGFSTSEIDQISHENVMRVLREAIK